MTCLSRLEVVGGNPIQACLDPRSRTLSTPPSLGGLGGGLATKSRLAWLVSDRCVRARSCLWRKQHPLVSQSQPN